MVQASMNRKRSWRSTCTSWRVLAAVALTLLCTVVGALRYTLANLRSNSLLLPMAGGPPQQKQQQTCSTRPAQKIFLDVGANRGDVLRIFLQHGQQPKDSNNRQWKFGIEPYDPQEWRIIAFEANPRMRASLEKLQQEYQDDHHHHQKISMELHVPQAVWTSDDETIPLGIDDTTEEQRGWLAGNQHGEWGSSVFENATNTVVSVPTLDFSRFARETVCEEQDTVYLKMNVEGAEFPVVRRMMEQGTLCLMDHVDIYWHSHLMPESERIMWKTKFIPLVRQYIDLVCIDKTQIHVWGVH